MLQFHKYEDLTEPKLREVVGGSRAMLVYDTKPRFDIQPVSAIDVGTFKISCWRGTLEPAEVAVFHLRKLTDDFLYTYFRSYYESVHIFSSDSCIKTVFAKPGQTHEIVLVPRLQAVVPDLLDRSEVLAYLGSSSGSDCRKLKKLHDLYAGFVGMAHLYAYKVNMAASLVCDAASSGCAVAALTRSKKLLANSTMLDARTELDRSRTFCIVFDAEDDFDYSSFRRCIFVVEDKDAEDAQITSKELDLLRALCPKQSTLGDMLGIGLGEFRDYMMTDSASTLALIAEKTLVPSGTLPFHRVDELGVGKALIPAPYARQLLDGILLEVKQALESTYLFVRSAAPRISSEHGGLLGREFQSTVSVPGLFDFECKSRLFLTKRESVADCCCMFIARLHEENLLNDHLHVVLRELLALGTVRSLLVKAYGTTDLSAVARIRAAYLDSHDLSAVGSIVERDDTVALDHRSGMSTPSDIFKKRHIVNTTDSLPSTEPAVACPGPEQHFRAECPIARLERCYRKIPACLCVSSSTMALYTFNNSETGMLCIESSRESCSMASETSRAVCISYAGARKYSDRELELLRLYQVLFFRHHGEAVPSHSQTLGLHYYVAPLDSRHCIDWAYLERLSDGFPSSPVIQSVCSENLVWNPFSREFLVHTGRFEKSIEDRIEGQSYLEYFERKYRVVLKARTGQVMFRAFLSDHVSSSIRKHLNAGTGELDVLPGGISSPRPKTAVISSSEICLATPVRVSILKEVEIFKRNYRLAETVFIAHELIGAFGVKATLQTVVRCLTQACESPLQNYERLEFLGDCVMKFSATSHFYHLMLPIDQIVLSKNSAVCNDNLFRICVESGLFRYIHTVPLSPKMVQAPALSGAESIIEYFNASGIFKSDNLSHHIAKSDTSADVRKLYADVVEALVGGVFLESGMPSAVDFMCRLKVLGPAARSCPAPVKTRAYDYLGLMEHEDILAVQKIIGYRFRNPGCLERAFVHPSFARALGSAEFQCLELIGDCSLDLFVSLHVFNNASLDSPMLLHSARASYVNNTALHRVLHRTGLAAHTKHSLDESTASKAYSDMVEALIGAILVDLGWDVKSFMDVMNRQFRGYLEDCRC